MAGRRRSPDRDADAVYRSLAPAVLGYFRSHRMRDPEGLTGDVFVAVAERSATFRGDDDALRRWVFTIAHHRRVDAIRRAGRRPEEPSASLPEAPVVDSSPFDPALRSALDRLTEDQRDVLLLRYVADLSVRDVARITGRRPGAVKMLQARGLDALRARLDDDP